VGVTHSLSQCRLSQNGPSVLCRRLPKGGPGARPTKKDGEKIVTITKTSSITVEPMKGPGHQKGGKDGGEGKAISTREPGTNTNLRNRGAAKTS